VTISKPPSEIARRRSSAVSPSTEYHPFGSVMICSRMYVTKNGGTLGFSSFGFASVIFVAFAFSPRCSVSMPIATIRLITSFRRSHAFRGLSIGSKYDGARIRPASRAASARFSSDAGFLK
jgi:hypothetical protein